MVLAGDPRLLGPVSAEPMCWRNFSSGDTRSAGGLAVSLFERLLRSAPYSHIVPDASPNSLPNAAPGLSTDQIHSLLRPNDFYNPMLE